MHQAGAGRRAEGWAKGIEAMMRPRSVAIVGMSSKPGTPSANVLYNLLGDGYTGEVHLVGRSGGTIQGLPCLTSVDQLPRGVDVAILVVAADAVRETVEACIANGVKSAVCFASGFAETGDQGRREQEEIGRIAREGGLALVGPNCVGYYNYIDAFQAMLAPSHKIVPMGPDIGRTLAVVTQSGGIGHHTTLTLRSRGVAVSYMVTTGNEAHLGLPDFIDWLIDQETTSAVVCYAEQIRRPADMIAVAERARRCGKPVILYHPGHSARARTQTASHSGALVKDYAAMRTIAEDSGVLMVDTLEELIDVGQLVWRYPEHDGKGLGVVTGSGAISVIAADYAETLGIDLPPMSPATVETIKARLPDYMTVRNPLDIGTSIAWEPDVIRIATDAVLADPAFGSVLVSNPHVPPPIGTIWAQGAVSHTSPKPLVYVIHDEDVPLPEEDARILRSNDMVVLRSPERGMRALARLTEFARRRLSWSERPAVQPFADLPELGPGAQPEWRGKQLLASIGIKIPEGGLARSADEATAIAARIGYPVALKAQSAALAHKSEAGGVLLDIADEAGLRSGWATLHVNVANAAPGLALDGVLVEKMGGRGLELAVGARRDPQWGPVLLIGMGGIWIEALGDVRLLAPTLPEARIVEEFHKLKGGKLLRGFRGSPPVDVAAVAKIAAAIGRLMVTCPRITEIDVNPVVAFAEGQGASALDALIVVEDGAT